MVVQDLINSFARFSMATTLFGIQQLGNTVEGVIDATRWTFFSGFTCPDCGAQQEVAREFRRTLDALTKVMTSQLDRSKQESYESLSANGVALITRAFDAADAVWPIRDDLEPADDRPAPQRGFDKRSTVPAFDPRRFF